MMIKNRIKKSTVRFFLWIIALAYIIPLLIVFTNSFMSPAEIKRNYADTYSLFDHKEQDSVHYAQYALIPEQATLEQYNTLLFKTPAYLNYFLNSVKITLPIVLLQILIGTLAAYGFTISSFRFKELLFYIYILVMLLPYQATSVSNYIMADKLGLVDSYLAIILPLAFSPFPVFLMRQSMKGIPPEILEAARLDGAGHLQILVHIVAPLSKSGIMSLFILTFCECWGMVEQPIIFIKDTAKEPLSLFLSNIGTDNMGLVFAAAFFYMIPAIWIFLYGQEYFEKGVELSALK